MNVKFHKITSLSLLVDFVLTLFAMKKGRSVSGLVLSIYLKAMVTQQNSAVWSVPWACAQPKHSGSGSNGQRDKPKYERQLAYSTAADNTALVILVPLEHVTKRNDLRALETRIGLT